MKQTERDFDLVVIGSGVSGSWVAKEASERGLQVLLLEAGRQLDPQKDFAVAAHEEERVGSLTRLKAMALGQGVQARCMSYTPATAHLFVNDRDNPYTTDRGARFNWYRSRQVGGRMHLWGRNALRMSDHEFKAAERDGFGDAWPIGYADLEPWYDHVETFIGVTGEPADIPNLPDGLYVAPHSLTEAERRLVAQMATKWPDRPATTCRIVRHMVDRTPPTLAAAKATGRFELRPNAVVERIETDAETGRATGVTFVDAVTKERHTVQARAVALAASAIESVRILLNSPGARHPGGLGNSSGNLGRYLTDHLMMFRVGSLPEIEGMGPDHDPYDFGQQSGIYIPSFRNREGDEGLGFRRGYSLLGSVGRLQPGWFFMTIGEVLPQADNRIELDPHKRDAWGIPAAKITLRYSDNEKAMARDMAQVLDELSATFGLAETLPNQTGIISKLIHRAARSLLYTSEGALVAGSSIHEAGGACMGVDPKRHVLDPFSRLYDASNVYVTDSASFPTSPFQNPGLTIMALSARAGAQAATDLATN